MCGIYLSVLVVGDLLVFPFLSKYVRVGFYFFFFKQKTASEFRISDWSSDVCSSDLHPGPHALPLAKAVAHLDADLDVEPDLDGALADLAGRVDHLDAVAAGATAADQRGGRNGEHVPGLLQNDLHLCRQDRKSVV